MKWPVSMSLLTSRLEPEALLGGSAQWWAGGVSVRAQYAVLVACASNVACVLLLVFCGKFTDKVAVRGAQSRGRCHVGRTNPLLGVAQRAERWGGHAGENVARGQAKVRAPWGLRMQRPTRKSVVRRGIEGICRSCQGLLIRLQHSSMGLMPAWSRRSVTAVGLRTVQQQSGPHQAKSNLTHPECGLR